MSLLNEQRKRNNEKLQQVKELARNGQWAEAKKLVDTLPNTPDVVRIRNGIEKQLFIATGEIPSVMENSMAAVDMDERGAKSPNLALKTKRADDIIPTYMPIRIPAGIIYFVGIFSSTLSVIVFFLSFIISDLDAGTAFIGAISGLFVMASGAMMFMFVDIARNTYITNQLLRRLADKTGEE